jgi:uncharacterized protein
MSAGPYFKTLILKLTAFCNLNCTYCYMFSLADRTYTRVPKLMPPETAVLGLNELVDHVRRSGGRQIKLILHGGEPTLWPLDSFRTLFKEIDRVRAAGFDVDVSLQTNGLQLAHELSDMLSDQQVSLGFSLDGPEEHNDQFRITHGGSGSYRIVVSTIQRVVDWGYDPRRIGILTVINPDIPHSEYLRWTTQLPTRNVSILWPIDFSWSNPPWRASDEPTYARAPKYGLWMAKTFEEWWNEYLERVQIRQFLDTISRIMGSRHHSDSIGNDSVDMFVLNTDGGIEYSDYLRAHRDGGSRTPFNIGDTRLQDLTRDAVFDQLLHLRDHLPAECRNCPEQDVCGGGFLAGRSDHSGFHADMRSVLCHDQLFYYRKVRDTIQPYLDAMAV